MVFSGRLGVDFGFLDLLGRPGSEALGGSGSPGDPVSVGVGVALGRPSTPAQKSSISGTPPAAAARARRVSAGTALPGGCRASFHTWQRSSTGAVALGVGEDVREGAGVADGPAEAAGDGDGDVVGTGNVVCTGAGTPTPESRSCARS